MSSTCFSTPHSARISAVAGFVACCMLPFHAMGESYTKLQDFNDASGYAPVVSPVPGRDGSLYGTTGHGGSSACGTFYKLTGNTFVKLADAALTDCAPVGMTLGVDGSFYGIAHKSQNLSGTHLFRMTSTGTITSRVDFPTPTHAWSPPIAGPGGILYGVADSGGDAGYGYIYAYTPGGTEITKLHDMVLSDGTYPSGPLVIGQDGRFYGTTTRGGLYNKGTLFAFSLNSDAQGGITFKKLYDVPSKSGVLLDLNSPLALGPDGSLYGTANDGGTKDLGGIFRVLPTGGVKTVLNFTQTSMGYKGTGGLALSPCGKFLGVTEQGGDYKIGVLFSLTPKGTRPETFTYAKEHSFGAWNDGNFSDGWASNTPVMAGNGLLVGTTSMGGANIDPLSSLGGVLYNMLTCGTPTLLPIPTAGFVGDWVGLIGTGFTKSSQVQFNGVAAQVQFVRSTFIRAQVPPTAQTGKISVTTSNGNVTTPAAFPVVSH